MACLLRPVITITSLTPDATASSTTYWIAGLSKIGSISLGCAFVAGRNRVPSPAAGITTFRSAPLIIGLAARQRRGADAEEIERDHREHHHDHRGRVRPRRHQRRQD